jgi:type IV pilus assembly protein PilV
MLIEALVGILIFSVGILALMGLQAVSIKNTIESKYRTEASFLANEIIGAMWVDLGTGGANLDNYDTSGACASNTACQAWRTRVAATLPSVTVGGTNSPSITVTNNSGVRQVQVTLRWRMPDTTAQTRSFTVITQINGN